MKINEVKFLNGEKVKDAYFAGETKAVNEMTAKGFKRSFYSYACFETENGNCYYIPTLKGELVLRTNIWNFINELPKIN